MEIGGYVGQQANKAKKAKLDNNTAGELGKAAADSAGYATGGILYEAGKQGYDKLVTKPQEAAHQGRQDANAKTNEAAGLFDQLQNPEFDTVIDGVKPTEFNDIKVDPALREAQMRALSSLENIGNSGGLLASDRAQLAATQRDAAQQDKARRDAILQGQAARGMAGSGNSLLAQLQSNQAATDRQNQSGLNIAGQAQMRALDAIDRAGNLGGGIRKQDYGEQADKATAQDAINKFNSTQNFQGIQAKNDWAQQNYANSANKAGNKANILTGQAATLENRADKKNAAADNNINTLLGIGGKAISAYGGGG